MYVWGGGGNDDGGGGGGGVFVRYLGRIKAIQLMKITLQKVYTLSGFSHPPPPLAD